MFEKVEIIECQLLQTGAGIEILVTVSCTSHLSSAQIMYVSNCQKN